MYKIEVRHTGLHKYRKIRGKDKYEVAQKAEALKKSWEEMWERKVKKLQITKNHEDSKELAELMTKEAQDKIKAIENILLNCIKSTSQFDWSSLKTKKLFDKEAPIKNPPIRSQNEPIPTEPQETHYISNLKLNILERLFPKFAQGKISSAKELFQQAHNEWELNKSRIIEENKNSEIKYQEILRFYEETYQKQCAQWEFDKVEHEATQANHDLEIDSREQEYLNGSSQGIEDLIELVLYSSEYPEEFPEEYDIMHNSETKLIIIDQMLPCPEDLPNIKEVKYIKTNQEFKEIQLSEAASKKLYDELLYQMILCTVYKIYFSDKEKHIQAAIVNGWIDYIDRATGQEAKACIMSIHTNREEFMSINLNNVDPKACFKKFKGTSSSKLYLLTPIAPLLQINREDSRFISSYDVADSINESVNLAAMDWKDFENLIRELFEKEFSQSGGEVKITQASRDGGVDAVIFDPDPIRGGKIIVQAKRYTNTVGLSAVRDLYGTVVNEGAIKGILVSTADYGAEAYNFIKNKPITLLDGANLLYLLQKHRHKAKIDLKEAKKLLSEYK